MGELWLLGTGIGLSERLCCVRVEGNGMELDGEVEEEEGGKRGGTMEERAEEVAVFCSVCEGE